MNLEKRIGALEKESVYLSEPHKIVVAYWWNPTEETKDEAIDRALAKEGMTREEISKPRFDGLPRLIVVTGVAPNPPPVPDNVVSLDSQRMPSA